MLKKDRQIIARANYIQKRDDEIARLTTINKEMYEALEYCLAMFRLLRDNPQGFTNDILASVITDASEVLAKAGGVTEEI